MKTKKPKKKSISTLWNKVSRALQDYYRTLNSPCYGDGLSCHFIAEVRHHHFHWGQSLALRLEEKNLVPLCQPCHMAYHNGNHRVKTNYEREMRSVWGQDWEDQLLKLEQAHVKKTEAEKREYLLKEIENYKRLTESIL